MTIYKITLIIYFLITFQKHKKICFMNKGMKVLQKKMRTCAYRYFNIPRMPRMIHWDKL